ncbi:unnamed protein product [Prunus armeniaca]|uniref:Uncharacterized protein n=1 Tax=Prunus armeniaca TaxID=36596 RepID=A0A6J5UEM4_PRUAR|nr:unnamed protein product [Prunus armeniaca]
MEHIVQVNLKFLRSMIPVWETCIVFPGWRIRNAMLSFIKMLSDSNDLPIETLEKQYERMQIIKYMYNAKEN